MGWEGYPCLTPKKTLNKIWLMIRCFIVMKLPLTISCGQFFLTGSLIWLKHQCSLINSLSWKFIMKNIFIIKKNTVNMAGAAPISLFLLQTWKNQVTSIKKAELLFQSHTYRFTIHLQLWHVWANVGHCQRFETTPQQLHLKILSCNRSH